MASRLRPPSVLFGPLAYVWARRVFLIVGALASIYFAERRMTLNREYPMANLEKLMTGTGWTPYQYRALVPWVSGLFWKAGYFSDIRNFFLWVEASFLFGCLVAFRQLVALEIRSPALCDVLGFSLFWVIPFNYIFAKEMTFFYPYDMASVFFFTVGLLLLRRENWKIYYPWFALATFNREITCFLTIIFVLVNLKKRPIREIAVHVGAQAAIWSVVKLIVWTAYSANRGGGLAFNVLERNATQWMWHFSILSSFGYAWVPVLFMRHRISDPFFQRAVLVFYPFLGAMLFVGRLDEMRIYGELTPIVLMGTILILKDYFREELVAPAQQAGSLRVGPGGTSAAVDDEGSR